VALTRDGKRLVDAILPEHVANERRLLGELSANQRAELAGLLEALAISLGDDGGASPRTLPSPRRQPRR
jgi:hypothetical protein